MNITTVNVTDLTNPVELQSWLDGHNVTIDRMFLEGNLFIILYH